MILSKCFSPSPIAIDCIHIESSFSISETIASTGFKLPAVFLFKNLVTNYLGFASIRPGYSPGFLNIPATPNDTLLFNHPPIDLNKLREGVDKFCLFV